MGLQPVPLLFFYIYSFSLFRLFRFIFLVFALNSLISLWFLSKWLLIFLVVLRFLVFLLENQCLLKIDSHRFVMVLLQLLQELGNGIGGQFRKFTILGRIVTKPLKLLESVTSSKKVMRQIIGLLKSLLVTLDIQDVWWN